MVPGSSRGFAVGELCTAGNIEICLAMFFCQKVSGLQKWLQRRHIDTKNMCYIQ